LSRFCTWAKYLQCVIFKFVVLEFWLVLFLSFMWTNEIKIKLLVNIFCSTEKCSNPVVVFLFFILTYRHHQYIYNSNILSRHSRINTCIISRETRCLRHELIHTYFLIFIYYQRETTVWTFIYIFWKYNQNID